MTVVRTGKARPFARSTPSGAFDQYLLDIQKLPMISDPDEEKRLARCALAGDEVAAERLVTANLRFVISYVKKYQGHGLDLSELVAIGNEGLLKAVKKFDPDHGVKFISYAVWWVRQAVLKALAEQTRSSPDPVESEFRAGPAVPGQELLWPRSSGGSPPTPRLPSRSTIRSRRSAPLMHDIATESRSTHRWSGPIGRPAHLASVSPA